MKYLKLVNTPLRLLENSKYGSVSPSENKIPWSACGFNVSVLAKKSVQHRDDNDDFIQYVHISDDEKFASIKPILEADVAELGEGFSVSVVDDDSVNWGKSRDRRKRRDGLASERRRRQINKEIDEEST